MDIDMVKSQETKNIKRLTNWRRKAKREISKESMTDSYEIQNSVLEWLKIIETKIFVDDGMLLRMKITLIIWQHKNTSTFRANGGFIQIGKILILCHWGLVWFQVGIVYLATIATRSRRRTTGTYLLLQTPTVGDTQFIFYLMELTKFMVDSLSFWKSRRRCTKYWVNGTTCCLQYLPRFFWKRLS